MKPRWMNVPNLICLPAVQAVFPEQKPIDRTSMSTWEDQRVTARVNEIGRGKLVIAALWTEVCRVFPVLPALDQGYEAYFVTDASGGMSEQIHNDAVHPVTDTHPFDAMKNRPLRDAGAAGPESDARFVATTASLVAEWQANRHLHLVAGYTRSFPGEFIEESGEDDSIDFVGLELGYTF